MRTVTFPSQQQEAVLREQAQLLRAAYALFPEVPLEPHHPKKQSTWQTLKGFFEIALESLPSEFDWRDHVAVPPVKYQGGCNSCTSFAAAAAIEIETLIANGGVAPDVSAQHMHTCIVHRGEENGAEICSFGIEPRLLLMLLKEVGYAVSQSDAAPFPPSTCPAVDINSVLRDFTQITASAARSCITKGPIVTDMYIWDDFFDYSTNRSQAYSPDMTLGVPKLHAVCVVGYTPDGWTIKNSLGPNWGDGTGFATIKKGACGLLTDSPPPGRAKRPAYTVQV